MKKKPQGKLAKRQSIYAYMFILPAFIFLFVFLFMPMATAVIKSFYRYDGMKLNTFIGLDNYKDLFFNDPVFWKSMQNLLVYFIGLFVCLFCQIVVARFVEGIKRQKLQNLVRSVFVIPVVVPGIVILLMWKFIYYPEIGVISRIVSSWGMQSHNFLGNPTWVNIAIIFVGFPWIAGTNFLILYSAFQGVDRSIIESAEVSGASAVRIFFSIELPLILPQIKVLLIFGIIGLMQQYEKNLILTNGGPNNASVLPGLHMYQSAFKASPEMGYACAISVVLFIITMILSVITSKLKEDKDA